MARSSVVSTLAGAFRQRLSASLRLSTWKKAQAVWVAGEALLTLIMVAGGVWLFSRLVPWLDALIAGEASSRVSTTLPFYMGLLAAGTASPLFGLIGLVTRHIAGPVLLRRTGWDLPLFTWIATQPPLPKGPLREWVRACGEAPSEKLLETLPLNVWTLLMARRDVWPRPDTEVVELVSRVSPYRHGTSVEAGAAVPPLVRFALTHPDRDVRAAALCWIGATQSLPLSDRDPSLLSCSEKAEP